jgi:hypothetical protein
MSASLVVIPHRHRHRNRNRIEGGPREEERLRFTMTMTMRMTRMHSALAVKPNLPAMPRNRKFIQKSPIFGHFPQYCPFMGRAQNNFRSAALAMLGTRLKSVV